MTNNLKSLGKRIAALEVRVAELEANQTRPEESATINLMIDGEKLGETLIPLIRSVANDDTDAKSEQL